MQKSYINATLTTENIEQYTPSSIRDIMKFIHNFNRTRKGDFIEKILCKKEHLKSFKTLDDEVLYDIRFTLPITYRELSEIFDISPMTIARIYQKRHIVAHSPCMQEKLFRRFGFRTVDVDKLIAYLTE